ncbi:hypothetical protein THRCLA_06175 [Thraustotheca clavata]|uniref:Helicase-associated domain-containing protein n=1 Tax=Thraustotheca clavata TaxID=74557 RepID=A0A1V9ZQ76_9STRA|nr:hypothetical protein THRCLA_06175 [Thraustotheca clavata]
MLVRAFRTYRTKATATPELSPKVLTKLSSFVDVVKILRQQQDRISDYTIVPTNFKVPNEAPWPESFRGKILATTDIRKLHKNNQLPLEIEQELEKYKLVWDVNAYKWQMKIDALSVYKKLYGDTNVPYTFVCPENDPNWPKDTWNTPLGKQVSNILKEFHRSKKYKNQVLNKPTDRQLQLIELEFNWDFSGN